MKSERRNFGSNGSNRGEPSLKSQTKTITTFWLLKTRKNEEWERIQEHLLDGVITKIAQANSGEVIITVAKRL